MGGLLGHSQVVAPGRQAVPGLWPQGAAVGWSEAWDGVKRPWVGRLWEAAGRRLEGGAEQAQGESQCDPAWPPPSLLPFPPAPVRLRS